MSPSSPAPAIAIAIAIAGCNLQENALGTDSGMLARPMPATTSAGMPDTDPSDPSDSSPRPPGGEGTTGSLDDTGTTRGDEGGTTGGDATQGDSGSGSSTGPFVPPPQSLPEALCREEGALMSTDDSEAATVTFTNVSGEVRRLYWLDYSGERYLLEVLPPDVVSAWLAYVTHPFLIADEDDECLTIFVTVSGEHEISLY